MFPGVVIRPLASVPEIRPRFVFPPNRPLSIAATEFLAAIRGVFADHTADENLIFRL